MSANAVDNIIPNTSLIGGWNDKRNRVGVVRKSIRDNYGTKRELTSIRIFTRTATASFGAVRALGSTTLRIFPGTTPLSLFSGSRCVGRGLCK